MNQLIIFINILFSINLKQLNLLASFHVRHKNLKNKIVQQIFCLIFY
jgi:hypothetical protein